MDTLHGKKLCFFSTAVLLLGAASLVHAETGLSALVVTASNATINQLLVYNSAGQLIQTVATQGKGGASGNAGGVQSKGNLVAVVNFGSQSVSIFERRDNRFQLKELVPTASSPLSVAFGTGHLYILGTTKVESHRMHGSNVNASPDGVVGLLKADGSAAQVGIVKDQLVITEKSNVIETVNLVADGAVTGFPALVKNIPANVDAPFGLITRGNNAYITIAHADEISLVRDGKVLTVTASGAQQHAPCWVALAGPFLFSSNSPTKNISRYAVYGQKIVLDAPVAAQLNGSPTDIASAEGLLAVIDGSGSISHLSIFSIDEDGNLTLLHAVTINNAVNGVAIVRADD